MTILLVEDDPITADAVLQGLQADGYESDHVGDGLSGLDYATRFGYDAVIVDRMVPLLDGLSLVKKLRALARDIPVIYLTNLDGVEDRVDGLNAGGTDYVVKPFAMPELLARIRVHTRKARHDVEPLIRISIGSICIDRLEREAFRAGAPLGLLPQEFVLLEYMMRHAGEIVTRLMLLEHVWGIRFDPQTSVVESHMSRLRAKLGGRHDEIIETVRGAGYRMNVVR